MKTLANLALLLAALSFVVGVISKITLKPVPILPGGLEAEALLIFTNTCILFAVALKLMGKNSK